MRIYLRIKLFLLCEQIRVIVRYYQNLRFAFIDLSLCLVAFFTNPYRISRKFTGEHSYGETPITTFAALAKSVRLSKEDVFIDLGSGRGKLCFWSSIWIGCASIGIEQVPGLVRPAKILAKIFRAPIHFQEGEMHSTNLSRASVVYLYTMEWDENLLMQMLCGARLITVGAPVNIAGFEVLEILKAEYPWGVANAYIQRRIG